MSQEPLQSGTGHGAPPASPGTACSGCAVPLAPGRGRLQQDGRIFCEGCHHRRHRLRTCAACGATVPRQDCHRNRYGEYLCRACQKAGVKRTLRGTLQKNARRAALRILNAILFTALGLLVVRFVLSALRHWDTAVP